MRHIAIVGSGPAGYYTAEAALKTFGDGVRIDVIDRLPVPFGLIRFGVAPDHQSIKAVTRRFEAIALSDNVHFVGHLAVGQDVSIGELCGLYDAVVLATGAPVDRPLGIPGADLPGVYGSAAFVGWYNGHPDFADLTPDLSGENAVIIGNGNVALDVARILAKTEAELAGSDIARSAREALSSAGTRHITLLGRRGPHQIAMTPKELGELGQLSRATPQVDTADLPPVEVDEGLEPGQRKAVAHLRHFAALAADTPRTIDFSFFARPVAIEGRGRVEALCVERTRLMPDGRVEGSGVVRRIPADMVVACIGYQTPPIADVPYDARGGRFANVEGRVLPGVYCTGWARRGPSGTIGTNRPDGFATVERIAEDWASASIPAGAAKAGRAGLDRLIAARRLEIVTFRDWRTIEAAEVARAANGAPREKFTSIEAMMAAISEPSAESG